MPMQDVTVEEIDDSRVVVIAPSAHQPDEQLMIHMATGGRLQSHAATVVSSTPVSLGGAVCFRVELRVQDEDLPPHERNPGEQ